MGLSFQCPHCERRLAVWFENPIDGGQAINFRKNRGPLWKRVGDQFDSLTITPSINAQEHQQPGIIVKHWHGFIFGGLLMEVQ